MRIKLNALLSLLVLFVLFAACSSESTEKAEFWVRGNCDMCKERIEESLNAVEGVQSAKWDTKSNIATVVYSPGVTSQNTLEAAVAGVGHSTKQHIAGRQVHDALPDCCQEGAAPH